MKKYYTEYGQEFVLGFPIKGSDFTPELIMEIFDITLDQYTKYLNDDDYNYPDQITDWLNIQDEVDARNGIQLLWADDINRDCGKGFYCYIGLQKDFSDTDFLQPVWSQNDVYKLNQLKRKFHFFYEVKEFVSVSNGRD